MQNIDLEKLTSLHLHNLIRGKVGFEMSLYGMDTINYKRHNLLKIIELFEILERKCDNTLTGNKRKLSKKKMAEELNTLGFEFTPHEINYIPKEEFVILYNNLEILI